MSQMLRPMDAARCLWAGGELSENLASPRDRLGRSSSGPFTNLALLREGVLSSRPSRMAVWPQRGRLQGVARARTRSGARAWEVTTLHVAAPRGEATPPLLDLLAQDISLCGGLRLFLRLPGTSPLLETARRAGFTFACSETLFTRPRQHSPAGASGHLAFRSDVSVRPRTPADDMLLFHLYCNATPASVRALLGMTREEWHDAQEEPGPRTREWVLEQGGKLRAWLHVTPRQVCDAEVLVHPDASPQGVAALVDTALAHFPGPWHWLVPEYVPLVGSTLRERDFQDAGRFYVLVRPMAVAVPIPSMAPAVEA